MKAAQQGGQHMAVGGVVVVAWPIKIGGHQADRIKAVLTPQSLTEFDATNFGDRIPRVGRLQSDPVSSASSRIGCARELG